MPKARSKKFSVFVAIFVLLAGIFIGGFLFIKTESGSANISDQFNYLLGKEKSDVAEDKNIDSDNDGLEDWQETIYKTDRNNSDTDNDGYLDGEEVASGYDPAKKAPGDELAGTDINKERPLPKNLTKALTKKIGQAILSGKIRSFDKTTGKPLTAEQLQNEPGLEAVLEETVIQQINEFIVPYIPDKEIKISNEISQDSVRSYLNALDDSLSKIPKGPKSEMQLFLDAILSRDFSKVEAIRLLYEDSYKRLKEVTVPSNLIAVHKEMLGILWVTQNIYAAVKNIDEDPLKTTIAIKQYRGILEKTKTVAIDLFKDTFKYVNEKS